jgi:putative transposase
LPRAKRSNEQKNRQEKWLSSERNILTGLGSVNIRQPRVRDKREGSAFSSVILPKYKRRTPSLEAVVPEL